MLNKAKPTSIEEYLRQVAHELRDLPSDARAEELREIKAHLGAMVGAHQTADVDETQALAQTLKQFGRPRKVGREMLKAWERKQPESWINAMLAFVVGCLFVNGHNYFWFNFQDKGASLFFFKPAFYYFYMEGFGHYFRNFACFFLLEALLTLVVGATIGLISPKRAKMVIIFVSPMLVLLDLFPFFTISVSVSLYYLSFTTLLKYSCLAFLLLTGAKFGARHNRRFTNRIAKAT